MRGGFLEAKQIDAEKLPWGQLAWHSRPAVTGAKQLVTIEVTMRQGGGHSFHKHPNQEELIYVISGRIEQWLDKDKKILGAGDSVFIPAGVVHASFNDFRDDAKVLAILGPCVGEAGYECVDVFTQAPWNTLRGSK